MRQIWTKVLALAGLCGLFVVSWNCKTYLYSDDAPFTLEPSSMNLDTTWAGVRGVSRTITMRNMMVEASPATLNFGGFAKGPTCPAELTWEPLTASIPVGDSLRITIHFDPEQAYPNTACALSVLFGTDPTSSKAHYTGEPPNLMVSYGAEQAGCRLDPGAELEFGDVEIGSSSDLVLSVHNDPTEYFGFLIDEFKPFFYHPSADCGMFSIDPSDTVSVVAVGESRDISVRFDPAAPGQFECTLGFGPRREPPETIDPLVLNACPSQVIWSGTGVVSASPEWSDCSRAGFDQDLHGIFGLSESEIYVGGDLGNVLKSGGTCVWDVVTTGFSDVNMTGIWAHSAASDTAIWAVGNLVSNSATGAILRSDGSAWEKVDEGWMVTYGTVWGSSLDDVYFVGTGVSTDLPNAKTWNGSAIDTLTIDFGMSEISGVHGTSSDDVWAVLRQSTASYSVYRFQGTQWESQTLPFTPSPLHDVWAVQGTGFYTAYAVGEDGAIYHFDGSTWTDESISGETNDFYGVWVSETGFVWVVGQGGTIYHKDATGWTRQNPPAGLERDLRDVWGSSDENVFAVGADGLILHYSW